MAQKLIDHILTGTGPTFHKAQELNVANHVTAL